MELLRTIVQQDEDPSAFEFRHKASANTNTLKLFEAKFSPDWQSIIDSLTGQRFQNLMSWAIRCRSSLKFDMSTPISVKNNIFYKGKCLKDYECDMLGLSVRFESASNSSQGFLAANEKRNVDDSLDLQNPIVAKRKRASDSDLPLGLAKSDLASPLPSSSEAHTQKTKAFVTQRSDVPDKPRPPSAPTTGTAKAISSAPPPRAAATAAAAALRRDRTPEPAAGQRRGEPARNGEALARHPAPLRSSHAPPREGASARDGRRSPSRSPSPPPGSRPAPTRSTSAAAAAAEAEAAARPRVRKCGRCRNWITDSPPRRRGGREAAEQEFECKDVGLRCGIACFTCGRWLPVKEVGRAAPHASAGVGLA
jgi:hypothetical protein